MYIYVYICKHVCTYLYMYVYICVRIHIYIYIYIFFIFFLFFFSLIIKDLFVAIIAGYMSKTHKTVYAKLIHICNKSSIAF